MGTGLSYGAVGDVTTIVDQSFKGSPTLENTSAYTWGSEIQSLIKDNGVYVTNNSNKSNNYENLDFLTFTDPIGNETTEVNIAYYAYCAKDKGQANTYYTVSYFNENDEFIFGIQEWSGGWAFGANIIYATADGQQTDALPAAHIGKASGSDVNISVVFAPESALISIDGKSYTAATSATNIKYVKLSVSGDNGYDRDLNIGNFKVTTTEVEAASLIDYTINYVLGGETIKSVTGASVADEVINAEAPFTVDGQKYYFADGAETSMTLVAGATNELNVAVRKAYEYNYTIKNNVNDAVKEGVSVEGESVTIPYSRYILAEDGKLYMKDATNKEYNITITPDADGYVQTLNYTATNKENVIFYSEGEEIEGMTATSANNANIRCSNAAAGYADEAITITTLEPGIYKVTLGYWGNSGATFNAKIGENVVATASTTGSWGEATSEEFTVTEATALTFEGTSSSKPLDFIFIQKTGEYEAPAPALNPVIEFTTAPADGATVKALKEVTLKFTFSEEDMEAGRMIRVADNALELVTVTKGEEAIEVASVYPGEGDESGLPVVITLAAPATEAGEYTINIAEGAVIGTLWDDNDGYVDTTDVSVAKSLTVTVDPNYVYQWSFTPENGSEANEMPGEDDDYVFVYISLPEAESLSMEPFDTENAVGPWITYNDTPLKKTTDEVEGDWMLLEPTWQMYGQPVLRIAINASVFSKPGTLSIRAEEGAFTVDQQLDPETYEYVGGEASPAFEYSAQFGEIKEYTVTIAPEEEEIPIDEFKEITITFEEAETVEFGEYFEGMLMQGWSGVYFNEENAAIEGNTVTVTIPETAEIKPGKYTLTFYEGSFTLDGNQTSPEITATFNVVRTTPVSFEFVKSPSTDIVNEGWGVNAAILFDEIETVARGENFTEITVEFNGEKLGALDWNDDSVMGCEIQTGGQDYPNALMINAAGGDLYNVETEGELKVTIPAGAIKVSGEANPEEIVVTWNVIKKKAYEVVITPANGEEVKSISEIKVEFVNAETAELFNQYAINFRASDYSASYSVASVEAVEDAEHPTFVITLSEEVTAEGTYDLAIYEGAFTLDGVQASPAIGAAYIVSKTAGINGIYSEDGKYTVVTLSGIVVLKDAEASALESLAKGIYIINGKKVALQ